MNSNNTVTDKVFDLTLTQSFSTLKLGTDAFLLSSYVKAQKKDVALEIGAGSGAISLILASRGAFKQIYANEIQEQLCDIMLENIKANGLSDKVQCVCGDIRFLNPQNFAGTSVVFSNPPYMKTDSGKASASDSKQIARHEVFGGAADFISASAKILKTGGKIYIVYRPDRLQTLMKAFDENGFSPKRMTFVHASANHTPSSVLCEATLGGKEQLTITRPLFLSENGTESKDCAYIYQNGVFPDDFF